MAQTPDQNQDDRIQELETELADRNRDLAVFREELSKVNGKLAGLIQQIGQELKLAHLIQKALVPTEFPNIPGFEFSTKFIASTISGGDYFDIFEHEDKFRFGIVLANSTGYGMSALFLGVLLKMTGQLEARKGIAPDRILDLMSKELVPNIQSKDRANVFYGVFDRRGFDLTYSSVGTVTALLQTNADGKLQRLEGGTAPFQQNFSGELVSHTLTLNPRDRLIMCSEGVIRARNAKGEAFGEERLYKTVLSAPRLSIHEMRNEILYQVEKFSAGTEIPQDVTVLVTEVKDRVIKLAKS